MCNQIVTNLNDIHDQKGKTLKKKQLKLICLLFMKLLKAEGDSPKREGIGIMKKSVMEKVTRIHENGIQ